MAAAVKPETTAMFASTFQPWGWPYTLALRSTDELRAWPLLTWVTVRTS
jgi:hypothetical protein